MSSKTRRDFLKTAAVASAGLTIVPANAVTGLGHKAPGDKMNIAGIGVGGKGLANLKGMSTENIIGLCDVDWKYSEDCFNEFPNAKKYRDWRKMFDELGDSIDGVMIATPDHTHAVIAATAIEMGKHVYCQKPLTHSIYESRLLTKLAAKHKVATQMGNQGNSGHGVRKVCEWIWNGEIGEIKEVHSWTDRPIWPQGLQPPKEEMNVPKHLNWDLFVGPASMRPYNEVYHPWNWRGWWDFGTGAFGDMGCHVLDPVFQALKLGHAEKVRGSSTKFNTASCPQAETVEYLFPSRKNMENLEMPPVQLYWYDGGLLPMRMDLLPDGENVLDGMGGVLFVGSKDTLICDTGGFNPRLLSGRVPQVKPYLRRIPGATGYVDGPHEQDWIRACKESPENRTEPTSNFAFAGPFNESVLLGVLAIRLKALNKSLEWEGDIMKFTNIGANDELKVLELFDFNIKEGHPHFQRDYVTLNAREAVNEYIRHTYRQGWDLPAMPA